MIRAFFLGLLVCAVHSVAYADAAPAAYPSDSIYQLTAPLVTHLGERAGLDIHGGHPVLVTLFYGSCPMTCPLLIDTLRAIEHAVPAVSRNRLRVLLISIDPERDTEQALQALAQARKLNARWTLARTDAASVRKIAALLNVQYRKLPDGGYNHASIVTLMDSRGVIAAQSTTLAKADPNVLQALERLQSAASATALHTTQQR